VTAFYLYVVDADAAQKRAIAAGAKELQPVADMFWGDRCGQVQDPFGYRWNLATRTQDLSPEEIRQAADAWMKQMAATKPS
jgi:PhnB protein